MADSLYSQNTEISDEIFLVLDKAFGRFQFYDQDEKSLKILSWKTNLSQDQIKMWFEKRRQNDTNQDVQILESTNDVSGNGVSPPSIEGSEPEPSSSKETEISETQNCVSSTTDPNIEEKAANYDIMKQQMENLKREMLHMKNSMEVNMNHEQSNPEQKHSFQNFNMTPNPNNYHHPQMFQQQPQPHQYFQYQYQHEQSGLPYPAYDTMSWVPQPMLPSNPYIHSSWCLPYPPPNFQIVIHSNPISIPEEPNRQINVEERHIDTPPLLTVEEEADDLVLAEDELEKCEIILENSRNVSDQISLHELNKVTPEVESEATVHVNEVLMQANANFEAEDKLIEEQASEDEILFDEACVTNDKTSNQETEDESNSQPDETAQVPTKSDTEVVDVVSESTSEDSPQELVSIVDNFGKKMRNESSKVQEKVFQDTEGSKDQEGVLVSPSTKSPKKKYRLTPFKKDNNVENNNELDNSIVEMENELDDLERTLGMDSGIVKSFKDNKNTSHENKENLVNTTNDGLEEEVPLSSEAKNAPKVLELQDKDEETMLQILNLKKNVPEIVENVGQKGNDVEETSQVLSFEEALDINTPPPINTEFNTTDNASVDEEQPLLMNKEFSDLKTKELHQPRNFVVKKEPEESRKVNRRSLPNKHRPPMIENLEFNDDEVNLDETSSPTVQPQQQLTQSQPRNIRNALLPANGSGLISNHPGENLPAHRALKSDFVSRNPNLAQRPQSGTATAKPPNFRSNYAQRGNANFVQHPTLPLKSNLTPQKFNNGSQTKNNALRPPVQKRPPGLNRNSNLGGVKRKSAPANPKAKVARSVGGLSGVMPLVGSTITVTKVVEPPTPPPVQKAIIKPSARPSAELERIMKMTNLSVSIKR